MNSTQNVEEKLTLRWTRVLIVRRQIKLTHLIYPIHLFKGLSTIQTVSLKLLILKRVEILLTPDKPKDQIYTRRKTVS